MSFNPGNISRADAAAYSSSDSDDNGEDDLLAPSADPRADDFGDFNPRKKRRTGRNAKESAALGIFGSDSDDDGPGRRWKGKKDLRRKNMSFVSAGQEKLDEQNDEDEDEEDAPDDEYAEPARFGLGAKAAKAAAAEEEDDEEDEEGVPGIGLGFRPTGQGLGWAAPTQSEASASANTPSKPATKTKYDGKLPLGKGFVPSSAHEPVLKDSLKDEPDSAGIAPKPSAFTGAGGKGKAMSFAERMMAKMGYKKGDGLGSEGQGRAAIIEPTLRPQGAGLGAVKEKSKQERDEEKRQARARGEVVLDSDEERKKQKRERKKKGPVSGSGSGASTPKPKTKYLTVNDIKKAAPGLQIPDAFVPILDLTGPDKRMLTSGSGIMTPTAAGTEVVEQTEARKLAGRAQRELNAYVEEWKTLEERKAWLDMETHQRQQEVDEQQAEFMSLKVFASVLDEIAQAAQAKEWDPVISGLRRAEAAGSTDEDLAGIAVAAIHPFIRDAVQGWQPLTDPKLGNFVPDLLSIQGVLGLNGKAPNGNAVARRGEDDINGTHRHHQKSTTPYETMIYNLLFPKLITAIGQQWDVYDPASLLAVFEKWELLLPAFVRAQLIDQVVRRLEGAIAAWKPRKKQHHLPHLWIFPWLEHMPPHHLDPKGTGIVSEVRRKYRTLIDAWEFDRGVIPGIKHWKEVFRPSKSQDQWKPLVMHHVLPGMSRYLRVNFRVDPSDQEPYLPMVTGVLKWADVVAPSMLAEVLVAEIFPLWHDVLYQWLTSDEVNYEEVNTWFAWWKDAVLGDIKTNESINAEFEKGLNLVEQALELGPDAKSQLPAPDRAPAHQPKSRPHKGRSHRAAEPIPAAALPTERAAAEEKARTFRDEIEDWCNENDLRFVPTPRSTDTGEKYVRITARMDGKGGVLAYFRKGLGGETEMLVVESRKTNMALSREKREEWDTLAAALFQEVE